MKLRRCRTKRSKLSCEKVSRVCSGVLGLDELQQITVSKMQEQALHNIISQVSTVKIKALDDMLQEIFAALKETKKDVYLPVESVER